MARELGGIGIRVNAIAPGLIDTDMARDNTPEDVLDREIKGTSLLRMGQAEEIANVIAFLCSDLSSYVTGQTWRVDGGM
jgi:3-oxoacyl-[acyl-carrier protein] reductase